jgi:hypothetical protein
MTEPPYSIFVFFDRVIAIKNNCIGLAERV